MKSIYRLEKVNGALSNGFKIINSQSGIPQSITVWVNDVDRVIGIISSHMNSEELED